VIVIGVLALDPQMPTLKRVVGGVLAVVGIGHLAFTSFKLWQLRR
jgi:hypothetical protein